MKGKIKTKLNSIEAQLERLKKKRKIIKDIISELNKIEKADQDKSGSA